MKIIDNNNNSTIMACSWSVAVFAHNEHENIITCLDSLKDAAHGQPLLIYVLANGCTDTTEALVRDYIATNSNVLLFSIGLGDKSNAWNCFVHEIAPVADCYFFIDGDVEACDCALLELYKALISRPDANAAAALPVTGRNCSVARKMMLDGSELAGNLYALSSQFIKRIREQNVHLPVGFIGEDGLVGALAKWDLDPHGAWDNDRIVPCSNAGFRFNSLSWKRSDHWRLYLNRLIRYRIRAYEFRLLGPLLRNEGLAGMPCHVEELFRSRIHSCKLQWNGIDTFFDWLALRKIKQKYCC